MAALPSRAAACSCARRRDASAPQSRSRPHGRRRYLGQLSMCLARSFSYTVCLGSCGHGTLPPFSRQFRAFLFRDPPSPSIESFCSPSSSASAASA
eukprot:1281671-Rhodomonas_salina.2